jgi:FtsH-binding integral membrane protein
MAKSSVHIGRLVDESLQLAWRYRGLWLLGIFAGYGMNFNIEIPGGTTPDLLADIPIPSAWTIIYLVAMFFLAYSIAIPALIWAIWGLVRTGTFNVRECLMVGVDVFPPVVLFNLVAMILFGVYAGFLGVIFGVLFAVSTVAGVISLVIIIPLGVIGMYVYVAMLNLTIRELTIRRTGLISAMGVSWQLIKRHPKPTV